MITREEIAEACNIAYLKIRHNAYFGNGFEAGVRFVENVHISNLEKQRDELREALVKILSTEFDGITAVTTQSNMKDIAREALKNTKP